MTDPTLKIPQRLLYSREETQLLLGGISTPTLKLLEQSGQLTPIRLTGRKRGSVYFRHDEIMALLEDLTQGASVRPKGASARPKTKRHGAHKLSNFLLVSPRRKA
jgi:hypothetical protein